MKNNLQNKRIAIVCDWIKDWWGAEIVLTQLLEIFPEADIFTSVFYQEWNPLFEWRKITTSFIQKVPLLNKSHKLALTLRQDAFESFDLISYDIVISSTSAESKWVITKPDCLHICYCHTPTRYFWSHYDEYLSMMEFGILNPLWKWLMPKLIHKLREWDFVAAQRPDYFIANSENTQWRITKYYKRESEVIYPCLDIKNIPFSQDKDDYYFYAGRVIPYKKFDLLVETFNKNGLPLKIVANTKNKLSEDLKKISKSNIEWIYETDNRVINEYHAKAKAFLFPPEEDFGLAPIAAQATGTPVIAYGKWWALETVIPAHTSQDTSLNSLLRGEMKPRSSPTGVFFDKQSSESLQKAIDLFETMTFDAKAIRIHAEQFDKRIFKEKLVSFIEEKLCW